MINAQERDERKELAELEVAALALEKRVQKMLKDLKANKANVGNQVFKEKPRVNKIILADGHALTTVKGSLYTAILTAMGKLGSLSLYDAQISCYNEWRNDMINRHFSFEQFLRLFGVRDWQIEAFVRSDPDFQAHCEKQTTRLQERASRGDAKSKKVLSNSKICVNGKWRGDFETAYEVLRQGHCPANTKRRRNLAILDVAGLLFDEIRTHDQRLFFLYPEKYYKEFSEIKARYASEIV